MDDVAPVLEVIEEVLEQGVLDGSGRIGRFEVLLRHVGGVLSAIREYVVPGAVPRRPRTRDLLVPLVAPLEVSVDIENDAPVVEKTVLDHVTHRKHRAVCSQGILASPVAFRASRGSSSPVVYSAGTAMFRPNEEGSMSLATSPDASPATSAWRDFCRRIEALGERMLGEDFPGDATGRAEGVAHLADQVSFSG